jgi:hypothetical protein
LGSPVDLFKCINRATIDRRNYPLVYCRKAKSDGEGLSSNSYNAILFSSLLLLFGLTNCKTRCAIRVPNPLPKFSFVGGASEADVPALEEDGLVLAPARVVRIEGAGDVLVAVVASEVSSPSPMILTCNDRSGRGLRFPVL